MDARWRMIKSTFKAKLSKQKVVIFLASGASREGGVCGAVLSSTDRCSTGSSHHNALRGVPARAHNLVASANSYSVFTVEKYNQEELNVS